MKRTVGRWLASVASACILLLSAQPASAVLNVHYNFESLIDIGANSGALGGGGSPSGGVQQVPGGAPGGFSPGNAASFDGNNGTPTHLSTNFNASQLGLQGGVNYTVAAWINPNNVGGDKMVFGQDSGNALHLGIRDGRIHFGHWGADSQSQSTIAANSGWKHVTWQYENGAQRIFINGVLDNNSAQGALNNNINVLVGRAANNGAYSGLLDDVVMYNEALSFNQIAALAAGANPAALPAATADPVTGPKRLNSADGHYYALSIDGDTWTNSKAKATTESFGGVAGHLATYGSRAEMLGASVVGNGWIGYTDDSAQAPGAFEGGNQTNFPVVQGTVPGPGQRGFGWAWIDGTPATFQHWNGNGEPNDAGGEDYAESVNGATANWNDLPNGVNRASIVEFDTQLGHLNVRQVPVAGMDAFNAGQALPLIRTALQNNPGLPTKYYGIDFADPESGDRGNFNTFVPFPGDTAGDDNNFGVELSGFLLIPDAGIYTFAVRRDDIYELNVNGQAVTGGCCGTTLHQFNLPAGIIPISALFGEVGGGADFEVSSAFGAFTAFDGTRFRIVGDVFNGGLAVVNPVPEPATAMLGFLGLSALALRRRRTA